MRDTPLETAGFSLFRDSACLQQYCLYKHKLTVGARGNQEHTLSDPSPNKHHGLGSNKRPAGALQWDCVCPGFQALGETPGFLVHLWFSKGWIGDNTHLEEVTVQLTGNCSRQERLSCAWKRQLDHPTAGAKREAQPRTWPARRGRLRLIYQPGGPYSKQPLGGMIPTRWKSSGLVRGSSITCNTASSATVRPGSFPATANSQQLHAQSGFQSNRMHKNQQTSGWKCDAPLWAPGSVQTSLQSPSRTRCQGLRGTCCRPEGRLLWAGTWKGSSCLHGTSVSSVPLHH